MNDLVTDLRSGAVLVMDGAMGTELMRWKFVFLCDLRGEKSR